MRNARRAAWNASQAGRGSTHLQIERLVLDGLSLNAAQAARLQATVERELGRMFAGTRAEAWKGGATRQMQAGAIQLAPGNSPAVWGRQIARTLFASLAPSAPARSSAPSSSSSPGVHTKF